MDSKFLSLAYHKELDTLYCIWTKETATANWEEVQAEMYRYIAAMEEHNPKALLIDERKMYYPWDIENQTWVAKNISSRMNDLDVKKIALVMSEDIIVQISTDQLFDEINPQNSITKYFESIEDAEAWIKK